MQRSIAVAVLISIALASAGAVAACPPNPVKPRPNPTKPAPTPSPAATKCVDFGAVPAISENIVAAEPTLKPKNPAYSAGTSAPYTGPTVGLASPGVKAVPT